jgi:hypothetical protein
VESQPVNPSEIEADCLVDIDSVPKLKRILTEWENRFQVSSLTIEKKSTRSINAKNELYQLIGFYSVFQGVVLTAVAQTSLIQCQQSWGPVSLAVPVGFNSYYCKCVYQAQELQRAQESSRRRNI